MKSLPADVMKRPTGKIGIAWSKLQWSLVHRGLGGTLRFALQRARRPAAASSNAKPLLHPFDQRYGVDTSGLIGGGELRSGHVHDVFNTAYYGMAPSRFRWVTERWIADTRHAGIDEYAFVDLGCGKGRAVMLASQLSFRQVVGVELHPDLARIAQDNLGAWEAAKRNLCPVQILCQDATEFVFPQGNCLLYLFNPFAAPVVRKLIERLESQFAARPGSLDIIYFNPESGDLFEAHPGFELLWSGTVPMSEEDTAADSVASPEDLCSVFRWIGTAGQPS
jgi:SAM-dependent methyltransferase